MISCDPILNKKFSIFPFLSRFFCLLSRVLIVERWTPLPFILNMWSVCFLRYLASVDGSNTTGPILTYFLTLQGNSILNLA